MPREFNVGGSDTGACELLVAPTGFSLVRRWCSVIKVTVCVGSSCHVRGSYDIIKAFDQIIHDKGLSDRVSLEGSFCMEHCSEAANLMIDGELHSVHSLSDAMSLFEQGVLKPLGVSLE